MNDYPDWIQPSTETYCVAPGCSFARAPYVTARSVGAGNEPTARFAVPGTDLCNWHHAQFPRVLADLVNMHPDLVAVTYARTSSRDENGRVSGGGGTPADVGTSWNPHAAAVLAELKDWTGYLVRTLVREYPSRVGITEDDDVRAQLRTIASWYAGWWSRYPGGVGPAVLADALQHRTVGLRAMHTEPVKRVTLKNGVCRHLIEEDVLGPILCGAPLYAIIRPKDDKPSEILCSTNPRHPQLSRDAWIDAMPR